MNIPCPRCNSKMIHGGDHDIEDDEEVGIMSNLSCNECNVYAVFFFLEETD